MSISDFLFEGRSPASVTTYGTTTESMPRWLNEYAQGVLSRANAIGAAPYEVYGGPRVADFTQDQQRAFEMTRGNIGSYAPYLQRAGQTFPEAASAYMNPYIENVTNRAGTLAQRNLTERFLPALSAKFGSRGSDVRSSAYRRAADRGVRDISEGLNEQTLAALAGGYDRAGTLFEQDATRFGNLVSTAQQLGLTDAAALETIGKSQQGLNQASLDTAYTDFQNQRDYDRGTLNWMADFLRSVPTTRNTASSETAPGEVGPSKLAQAGSLATGIAGLIQAFRKSRGGRIRHSPRLRYYGGGTLGGY